MDDMRGMKALMVAGGGVNVGPAVRLAAKLTMGLPLPHLLENHPRFREVYGKLPEEERVGLEEAWGGGHAGFEEMVTMCWVQELFDWEGIGEAYSYTGGKDGSESGSVFNGTIPCRKRTSGDSKRTEEIVCLSYAGSEAYSVWSELVKSELTGGDESRERWAVKVKDFCSYVKDDRHAHAPITPPPTASLPPQRSPSIMSQNSRPTVSVEGEPSVGVRLHAVMSQLPPTAEIGWYGSVDGWEFSFVKVGSVFIPTPEDLHKYLQVRVECHGVVVKSKVVMINVSDETNEALVNLVAKCVGDGSPAEFSATLDDATVCAVLLTLGGSLTLLDSIDEVVIPETPLISCTLTPKSPLTLTLTTPTQKHLISFPSVTSRNGLLLASRLFTSFPIDHTTPFASLPDDELTSCIANIFPETPLVPGALPTLLYKVEQHNKSKHLLPKP